MLAQLNSCRAELPISWRFLPETEGGHRRLESESSSGQDSRFHQAPLLKNADLPGIASTPHNQSAPRNFRPFVHARQAIVSLTPTCVQNLRVDTFPVVPDEHPELPVVIVDANLNSRRVGVLEGVAQGLAGDAVHFVPKNRMQISCLAFPLDLKGHRIL